MATCALVGASEFNGRDFRARLDRGLFDGVVAADGGYAHLCAAGAVPDLAIGDFDSLGFVPEDVPVVRHPREKDESDLELALREVARRGFSEVFVYGALGGRLDHTLANLQLFALFSERGLAVTAIDRESAVRLLTGPTEFDLPPLPRGTVSVFAAGDAAEGVMERGLKWSLEGATLTNRTSLGLSNELVGAPARIGVERGTLYVFYPLEER